MQENNVLILSVSKLDTQGFKKTVLIGTCRLHGGELGYCPREGAASSQWDYAQNTLQVRRVPVRASRAYNNASIA